MKTIKIIAILLFMCVLQGCAGYIAHPGYYPSNSYYTPYNSYSYAPVYRPPLIGFGYGHHNHNHHHHHHHH